MTDEEFHSYKIPGVTAVLDEIFGHEEFANIPESVLQAACERGSAVHKSIEDFINKKYNKPKIAFEYQIYIDYFNDWYEKHRPTFIFSELKLVSEEMGYKGIIDTLFLDNYYDIPELVMCDWKTSSNLNVFKAKCQLNLYLLLLEEKYPNYKGKINKLKILSLTKKGYKYYVFEPDRDLALSLLKIYKEKKNG